MNPVRSRSNDRERLSLKSLWGLLRETVSEWSEDKAPRLGAALAYYAVFSLAPLLVIAIAVASLVFDPAEVQRTLLEQMGGLVGGEGADLVGTMIENARQPAAGVVATVISLVTLLLGALGAFGQLQDALNTIWEVKPKPGRGVLGLLRDRLLSLGMVLVIGFLLLVSLVVSTALAALGGFVGGLLPDSELLLQVVNFVISFIVITVLFALMFKYLPDAKIAWNDVWIGAAITALLFAIGKLLIGLYLGNASVTSTYGAAGSLVVLLLWMYYSAQIFFLGAEFTQVYANRFGSRVVPGENAERVTEAQRAQEGMPHEGKEAQEAPAAVEAPGTALVPGGLTLPVVGPYVPLIRNGEALTASWPEAPLVRGQAVLTALLTFVAGLGAGAVVAVQSGEHARTKRNRRTPARGRRAR